MSICASWMPKVLFYRAKRTYILVRCPWGPEHKCLLCPTLITATAAWLSRLGPFLWPVALKASIKNEWHGWETWRVYYASDPLLGKDESQWWWGKTPSKLPGLRVWHVFKAFSTLQPGSLLTTIFQISIIQTLLPLTLGYLGFFTFSSALVVLWLDSYVPDS